MGYISGYSAGGGAVIRLARKPFVRRVSELEQTNSRRREGHSLDEPEEWMKERIS